MKDGTPVYGAKPHGVRSDFQWSVVDRNGELVCSCQGGLTRRMRHNITCEHKARVLGFIKYAGRTPRVAEKKNEFMAADMETGESERIGSDVAVVG